MQEGPVLPLVFGSMEEEMQHRGQPEAADLEAAWYQMMVKDWSSALFPMLVLLRVVACMVGC